MKLNVFEKLALSFAENAIGFVMNKTNNENVWQYLFSAVTKIGYILDKCEK
jgi:hypothetical protein